MDLLKNRKKTRKARNYKRIVTAESIERMNQDSIQAYNKYLEDCIRSNPDSEFTTYKVYKSYFYQFLVYLTEEQENVYICSKEFTDNAKDIMKGFMTFCTKKLGNNKKIVNTKLSAVSSFYHWMVKEDMIEHHPFSGKIVRLKNAKQEKIIESHFLEDEEIELITKVLLEEYKKDKGERRYDIQDLLIWLLMLDSAARLAAIQSLSLDSLDMDEYVFEDITEKGAKVVEVMFMEETAPYIKEWIEMRSDSMDGLECDGFFITYVRGEWRQMSSETIYARVRKIGEIIGEEAFRPHSIRKTAANRAYNNGNSIEVVQAFLNHESSETTLAHYIKPKSAKDIRKQLRENMNKK